MLSSRFIDLVQKNRKTIVVTEQTYETLRHLGTITDSFDDVIGKLIQKAASGQSPLVGSTGQNAVADRNDLEVVTAK